MTSFPNANEPRSLYELSWHYAQDGKMVLDTVTGNLVDVNPSFEALMGYSREELIGTHFTGLHPENERERAKDEESSHSRHAAVHTGFHILRKDGCLVPVQIWASDALTFNGREMVVVEFRDITDRLQREHLLSAQNWALSAFSIASLALGRAHTAASLLQTICEAITNQSAYVVAWIGIADEGPEKTIRIAASAGSAAGYLDGLDLSWSEDEPSGRGPTGICVRTGTVQLANDTSTAPAFDAWRERARQFGIRSSASIPLVIKGSWKGALVVYAKSSNAFETAPIEVFQHLSEQVVRGILALEQTQNLIAERYHLEETQKQLTEALTASVGAIVTAMEMRDPYTAGHESRVAEIAVAIGSEMGWNDGRLQGLRMAAMVHDIGKISIPAEILTKPTQLSSGEWTLIREHPETGYSILRKIPFTWPVAEAVRQHHERLDGSGYPRGLKGDAILPEARILAVADIVEAMTCHRPYRPGMALETVLEKIEKDAGTLLDPEVVRVCVKLFREKHLVVPGWNPS